MATHVQRTLFAYLGTCIAWGSTFALVAVAVGTMHPADVVFGRSLLGALVLLVLAAQRRTPLPRGATTWGHLWVVSLLASVIPGLFVCIAETRVSSALTGILAGMIPLATLLFLVTVFREEKVHPHQLVGLVVGFLGLLVITGVWQGFGHNCWWAVLLLIVTIFSYGLAFPYIKRYLSPLHLDPLSLASGQQLMAVVTLIPFVLVAGLPHHVPGEAWWSVAALGIFAGGFAFKWNFETVAAWGSSIASTVEYVCALVAVVEGVFWLHESVQWFQPVGGAIVIVAALIGWGQLRLPTRVGSTSN